ncbi:MAG: calcium-binding protein [Gemmobacter sp.]|nr:calcium-binding protein [Gemmobacter sp.]
MATQIGYSSIGTGVRYDLGEQDSIYVLRSSSVVSTDGFGISGTGFLQSAVIAGDVFGETAGIRLGDNQDLDWGHVVHVQTGASVSGDLMLGGYGVYLTGYDSQLLNDGSISGGYGVMMRGDGSRIVNTGTIQAGSVGLANIGGIAGDTMTIVNTGIIAGGESSLSFMYSLTAETVINRGLLIGDVGTGGGDDVVDNRGGRIEGDVYLGAGADLLDNRDGVINGTIRGEDGADTIRPGAGIEVIDGGAQTDVIDFRGTPAVQVGLDGSVEGTGYAAGDSYSAVENVYGSFFDDLIVGNAAVNYLFGSGGADVIDGRGGSDILRGGNGRDTLTGGAGNDSFRFLTLAEIGDTITDFSNVTGNNDRFQIGAAGFGGGLVPGPLNPAWFRSRADNLAQDADDRFIFRTTDRSLWFDVDGTGAAAPVMVADLQAGAVVTAADLLIL